MLDDDDLQRVYQWVDEIPLSRPKRNISRDFADGVLTAEIVQHYFPRLIELHNYPAANSYSQKIYNWKTLNTKVFKKMGFQMQQDEMDALANCAPQTVERMLKNLQQKMAKYGARKSAGEEDSTPEPTGMSRPYKPPPKPELHEMRETVSILEIKIQKLEQLVRLKDSKIATLQAKLQSAAGS